MSASSTSRRAFFWVVLIFVLGLALGSLGGYYVSRRSFAAGPPRTDAEKRAHRVEQLTDELGLTAAQRQHLDQILTAAQAEYKAIHDRSQPQIEAARQKTRNAIREILTPDQKPKFEEFLKRLDEERRRAGRQ